MNRKPTAHEIASVQAVPGTVKLHKTYNVQGQRVTQHSYTREFDGKHVWCLGFQHNKDGGRVTIHHEDLSFARKTIAKVATMALNDQLPHQIYPRPA